MALVLFRHRNAVGRHRQDQSEHHKVTSDGRGEALWERISNEVCKFLSRRIGVVNLGGPIRFAFGRAKVNISRPISFPLPNRED